MTAVLKPQSEVRLKQADKKYVDALFRRARRRISKGAFSKLSEIKHSLSQEFFALEASSLLSQGKRHEASELLKAVGIEPLAAGILVMKAEER